MCVNNADHFPVEDAVHVCFHCLRFRLEREHYLYSWYTGGNTIEDFFNLLKSESSTVIKKLAIYINGILKIKDSETELIIHAYCVPANMIDIVTLEEHVFQVQFSAKIFMMYYVLMSFGPEAVIYK